MLTISNAVASEKAYTLASGEVLHDPTKPVGWGKRHVVSQARQNHHFTLNYIRLDSGHKTAMINGKKVIEGSQVSGAIVSKIKQSSVTLLLNGERKVLRINKMLQMKRR